MSTDEAIEELRELIRFNGDWGVQLDLFGSYGCFRISVMHLGRTEWDDIGMDLGKRLERARAYLASRVGAGERQESTE